MRVKVFSKIGEIYTKIHEEEIGINDIDRILSEWKFADLIEIFDDERLLYSYTSDEI